jgi:RsmE family RNA methyltransferase
MARHVPHLYLPGLYEGPRIGVVEATRNHLEKVLRNQGPLRVSYTDGLGIRGKGVYANGWVERGREILVERERPVTLGVAPPKNKSRARFIVEKLAELGVARLIWLTTLNTEGRPPRIEKSASWAQAALEQSRGAWLMEVAGPVTFPEIDQFGSVFVADQKGEDIGKVTMGDDAVLCIGPEGGFADEEVSSAVTRVRLADNVLRVETAALAAAVLATRRQLGHHH